MQRWVSSGRRLSAFICVLPRRLGLATIGRQRALFLSRSKGSRYLLQGVQNQYSLRWCMYSEDLHVLIGRRLCMQHWRWQRDCHKSTHLRPGILLRSGCETRVRGHFKVLSGTIKFCPGCTARGLQRRRYSEYTSNSGRLPERFLLHQRREEALRRGSLWEYNQAVRLNMRWSVQDRLCVFPRIDVSR